MLFELFKNIFGGRKRQPDSKPGGGVNAVGKALSAVAATRYNMGCGNNKFDGYINVDSSPACEPDVVVDLESLPWPFETSIADEVAFNHSLEHIGQTPKIFLGIMKELYRISKPGANIFIKVPHPRHDNFINDPTHVRAVTPQVLKLFDKEWNDYWKKVGDANSTLAHYLGVNFKLVHSESILAEPYKTLHKEGKISSEEIDRMSRELNNIVEEYFFKLNVIKP